jgi:hypothetical protein
MNQYNRVEIIIRKHPIRNGFYIYISQDEKTVAFFQDTGDANPKKYARIS